MFRPKNVAIIGGAGQMGIWFSKFFADQSCNVTISGRNFSKARSAAKKLGVKAAKSNVDAIKGADLVIISVMADKFEKVVSEIAPYATAQQKIIDVTSVKEMPVRMMHKYLKSSQVLGTHPMFGPSAKINNNQNFVLTPTNPKEKKFAVQLSAYLRQNGFNVITLTPKDHDKMIGIMLSLTHFVGFVTADTWQHLGIEKHMKTSSTSFRFLKSFVYSIVESNAHLYSYLQTEVPEAAYAEKLFVERSKKWAQLSHKKRSKELVRRISSLRRYISRLE